jgi:hypothetical protein
MPDEIAVVPWTDPVIDTLGHDPRSWYAETFWLPTLGPTSLLLLRHLADRFERVDAGTQRISLVVTETAAALGLGTGTSEHAPLMRSMSRLVQFDLACRHTEHEFAVRRLLPPVNRRHVRRLPATLQARHEEWSQGALATSAADMARRRARRVAFTLYELGDDIDAVERVLHAAGFPPTLCRDAAEWAQRRHREAFEAATATQQ